MHQSCPVAEIRGNIGEDGDFRSLAYALICLISLIIVLIASISLVSLRIRLNMLDKLKDKP